jgi:Type II CAAX prenyl endopeptidase Rce1-like
MSSQRYPWKELFLLAVVWALLTPLALPFQFVRFAQATHPPPLPESLWLPIAIQAVPVGLAISALGLFFGRKIGRGLPYLEYRYFGGPQPAQPLRSIVGPALGWAAGMALLAFAIDAFFYRVLGATLPAAEIHARLPPVHGELRAGLLASLTAGYTEEVAMRLFLMSLLVWLAARLLGAGASGGRLTAAFWIGNLLSTLPFGWLHTGLVELFGAPAPVYTLRTLLIVAGPGLAFGWLYWKRGLEAAILSHFTIDVIVHVLRPAAERFLTP